MPPRPHRKGRFFDGFLDVGIWVLFALLLVPAGFVGWAVGRSTTSHTPRMLGDLVGHAALDELTCAIGKG